MLGVVGLPDLLKLCAGILLITNAARERILNSALQGWSRSACGLYVEMGKFAGTNTSCDEQDEAARQGQSRHLPPPHRKQNRVVPVHEREVSYHSASTSGPLTTIKQGFSLTAEQPLSVTITLSRLDVLPRRAAQQPLGCALMQSRPRGFPFPLKELPLRRRDAALVQPHYS